MKNTLGSLGGHSLRGSTLGSVQSRPRVMYQPAGRKKPIEDVPLSKRGLDGLESQGIARTLGTDASDVIDMEDAAECMRPGEVMLAPGVCGPDTRRPVNPYAAAPPTTAIPVSVTKAPTTAAKAQAMGLAKNTKLYVIGGLAVAAIYFLGRK